MTLSILFSALFGVVTGYPLMKLDLKSVQREKMHKILEIVSIGLAIAVFILPFFLFRFPAALVFVGLMALAGVRKTLAAFIFVFGFVYLREGWEGMLFSLLCPGVLLIPIVLIFLLVRSHSTEKKYTTLGIAEESQASAQKNNSEMKPAPKYSLRLSALYCSLLVLFVEFGSLNVGAIQDLYSREKALPKLVQAAKDDQSEAFDALKDYGKEAIPFEIEIIRDQFQKSDNDKTTSDPSVDRRVAKITSHILEMGEVGSLRQLGEYQKKALRNVAKESSTPEQAIAIKELIQLNAIPELVSLLSSNNYLEVMDALRQLSPSETIPAIMDWRGTYKVFSDARGTSYAPGADENYCIEIAKYGARAVPALLPYLLDKNSQVKDFTTQIVIKIGTPVVPALKPLLTSNNENEVTQTAYILGMLGDKSALPVLIEKIKNGDHSLSEALSFISDERATQCLIAAYEIEKNLLTEHHNKNDQSLETYELLIANTKTDLAKNFLEKVVKQTNSLTHRKKLLDALCNDFWTGTRREKITAWIETIQNFSGADTQSAAVELRKIGDPIVLPFLIKADDREHRAGLSIQKCEIHAAIAAFSK